MRRGVGLKSIMSITFVTASQRSIFVAQMPQIVLAPKLDKTASSAEPAVAAAAGLGGGGCGCSGCQYSAAICARMLTGVTDLVYVDLLFCSFFSGVLKFIQLKGSR